MRPITFIFLLLLLTQKALAENPICAPSGEIVQTAVDARIAGQGAPEAIQAIIEGLPEDRKNYEAAVQPLVDWVYSLPEDQLDDGVSESYVAACQAQ